MRMTWRLIKSHAKLLTIENPAMVGQLTTEDHTMNKDFIRE